jgi:DNA (cytosine-5)-methyltransferase 1
MKKWHYYNEIDTYAAEWIRNLIKKGHVPDGEVDTRSIVDVEPDDLKGFIQCHWFAGILGWSVALQIAGWGEGREIWSGSCPCQPFSVAGKGKGTADERHLWPHFHRLIAARRPKVVVGEQVSGKAGYGWLDGVRLDLEGEGYTCEGFDIPACAVNAPHIRQRLYWVAMVNPDRAGQLEQCGAVPISQEQPGAERAGCGRSSGGQGLGRDASSSDMADALGREPGPGRGDAGEVCGVSIGERREKDGAAVSGGGSSQHAHGDMADATRERELARPDECASNGGSGFIMAGTEPGSDGIDSGSVARLDMGDTTGLEQRRDWERDARADGEGEVGGPGVRDGDMADATGEQEHEEQQRPPADEGEWRPDGFGGCGMDYRQAGPWDDAEWLTGADGKTRRAKSGVRLLAASVSGGVAFVRTAEDGTEEKNIYSRVGALRCFGNAIVPPLAAEFIKAIMDTERD